MSNQHPIFLGLDVGGTKCAAVIGNREGEILARVSWPSDASRGPAAMIGDLCTNARKLIAGAGGVPAGVGVVIGGPLNSVTGIIHSPPNLPGWDDVPLREILENELQLPVAVAHDAAACALAEQRWGAAAGLSRVAYLTCGTGFGAGLVFDGKMYHGSGGKSPEIGHVRYCEEGPVAYGKQGCFESYAAGSSLPRLAAWKFPARWAENPPPPRQISELASQGDPQAQAILDINARAVADGGALLADLLALDMIVLGSLAIYLGNAWIDQVRARFIAQCLPDIASHCRIEPPGLGDRLQDCSALAVAL